jgi:hypothetical protein
LSADKCPSEDIDTMGIAEYAVRSAVDKGAVAKTSLGVFGLLLIPS